MGCPLRRNENHDEEVVGMQQVQVKDQFVGVEMCNVQPLAVTASATPDISPQVQVKH